MPKKTPDPNPTVHPTARELAAAVEADHLTELAAQAFEAYNASAGGKTWDGKDIPPFTEVGEKVQTHWRRAVAAVLAAVELPRMVHTYGADGEPKNAVVLGQDGDRATLAIPSGEGVDVAMEVPFAPAPRPGHWSLPPAKAPSVATEPEPPVSTPDPTPAPREPETPAARPDPALPLEDPDPAAKYSDDELRVARAMYTLRASSDDPPWEKVKQPFKRVLFFEARGFLNGGSDAARLVAQILKG